MDDIAGRITSNKQLLPGYYLMKIRLEKPMDPAAPGQFVMVRIPGNEVFLRRPFGIYHYDKEVLTLMYRVVGKGTDRLSRATAKERVFVLGPLGKGFRLEKRDRYLVVAGGIGIAGVHSLIEALGPKATLFFGCASAGEAMLVKDLARLKPHISTMDGSHGFKGDVVSLLETHLREIAGEDIEIFTCGPEKMMKSLRRLIETEHTPCQVLVEERMACGLGLCFGCVIETTDEHEPFKRVCREGPVFDLWETHL